MTQDEGTVVDLNQATFAYFGDKFRCAIFQEYDERIVSICIYSTYKGSNMRLHFG